MEHEFVKLYHSGYSCSKIGKMFGVSDYIVRTTLRKLGIKIKKSGPYAKYKINTEYFFKWSYSMAYILGYIIADGCIDADRALRFNCGPKDIDILKFIQSEIGPDSPIKTKARIQKSNKKSYLSHTLVFSSKEIVKSLHQYGIVCHKGGNEILPICDQKFIPDLIHGIFDGDGCIANYTYHGKFVRHLSIVSQSEQLLTAIKERTGLGTIRYDNNVFRFEIRKYNDIIMFGDMIFNKSKILGLTRKRLIYNQIVECKLQGRPKKYKVKHKLLGD